MKKLTFIPLTILILSACGRESKTTLPEVTHQKTKDTLTAISPTSRQIIIDRTQVDFKWEGLIVRDGVNRSGHYELSINGPSSSKQILTQTSITKYLYPGTYIWIIKAINVADFVEYSTDTLENTFEVELSSTPLPRFADAPKLSDVDNTFLSSDTKLTWSKTIEMNSSLSEANTYCKSLGGLWRLPTIQELVSVTDYSVQYPLGKFKNKNQTDYKPPKSSLSTLFYTDSTGDHYDELKRVTKNFELDGFNGKIKLANVSQDALEKPTLCVSGLRLKTISDLGDGALDVENISGTPAIRQKTSNDFPMFNLRWAKDQIKSYSLPTTLAKMSEDCQKIDGSNKVLWRLPSLKELFSIYNQRSQKGVKAPFDFEPGLYLTSSINYLEPNERHYIRFGIINAGFIGEAGDISGEPVKIICVST